GLGWDKIESVLGSGFPGVARFERDGVVSCFTSQFPSTTVVHSTTAYTGLTPGRAGVLEWFYHEPRIGRVIAPFLLNRAGDTAYGTLKADGFSAADVFPEGSFIRSIKELGAGFYSYSSSTFTPSDFSRRVADGAVVVPTTSPSDAFARLAESLSAAEARGERSYHFVYLDGYDALEHRLGADSPTAWAEASAILTSIGRFVDGRLGVVPAKTGVMVSADHGQVNQRPAEAIYLNERWPGIIDRIETGAGGQPLIGAGGIGRSAFLNLKPGSAEASRDVLTELLSGRASVHTHDELLGLGLYGPGPHVPDLRQRAGDLVILPFEGETVWWRVPGRFEVKNLGNHGGLSSKEMEIPFMYLAL
ncbi:MAG TPA: alkaline phosphatase family protein, partial [Spirochaetia bacterium]|nr:alkaline phosphatase family protein [Spirochaetia bacterium]